MRDSGPASLSEAPAGSREFLEFRRKVCQSEMLSAAMERLLEAIGFSGRALGRGAERPRAEIRL
jgi:hypothetical protein